jgi:ACDE family multidrug resistance protein
VSSSASAGAGLREVLRQPEVRAVVAGSFVIMLGFGILAPVLPLYARTFGVGYDEVGILTSSFALTRLAFDLVAGRMVDRFGERAMASTGALVLSASSAAAALAPTFGWLVIFRAIGGVGSSVFFAALFSYLMRTVPGDRMGRAVAGFYGSFNLGFIVGPPLGGLLVNRFGYVSPLWVYAAACAAAAAVYLRLIRTLAPRTHDGGRRGAIRRLPWGRAFAAVLACEFAALWIVGALYLTLLSLFGTEELGLSAFRVTVGLSVASLTEFFVLFPAGSVADRRGRKHVLVPGLALLIAGVPIFALVHGLIGFWVGLGFVGVLTGLSGVVPAAMLSDVVPQEARGTATGVFRFTSDLALSLGPLAAGLTAQVFGLRWAIALSVIPAVPALVLAARAPETRRTLDPEPESAALPG